MHAVNGHIAQARLGAANLHVLALALVALQGHAGQPANGIGDVGIRQAGDDFGGQHLHNVVGGSFAIERLDLSTLALSANDDLLAYRLDLKYGV